MQIVTAIVTVIHILLSIAVVVLILLHSGRGGGLSDVFGGGISTSNLGGSTLAERNLNRITVITGVLFGITTVVLTLLLA
ncbi:MAG: preprotein translocase subunit SecG [Actinomycetes bacterium]|jgi:preprotein translocase subunit SecG|nr:preprotein translocase subunit SecG [Acidimicrobiia bacterium]